MFIIFSSLWSYFKFKSNLKICRFKRYKIRLYDPWYSNLISKIVFIMSGRNMIWLEKRYEYFTPPDVFSSSFLIIHKSIYLIYIKLHTHIYINTIEISEKILTNLFNIRLILFKIAFDFFSEDLAAVREQKTRKWVKRCRWSCYGGCFREDGMEMTRWNWTRSRRSRLCVICPRGRSQTLLERHCRRPFRDK